MGSRGSLLAWIIAFKAVKAALLAALGCVLLFSTRSDPVELFTRLALAVHLPSTSRVFDRMLRAAAGLTVRKEVALAITAWGYAILMGTEGVGLYLRRRWARWFTIGATSSLIPIEMWEIVREPRAPRVLILLLNAGVVVYLFRRKEQFE